MIGTEDRVIPPATQRSMAERAGATISEVAASHVSMVSHPDVAVDANPDGLPAVYSVGGRQYVAFFAGNIRTYNGSIAWKLGKPEGQGYYVYALPK